MDWNVYILDKNYLFRQALGYYLQQYPGADMEIVTATDNPVSLKTTMKNNPAQYNILFLDIYHVGDNPYTFTRSLKKTATGVLKIIVCSFCSNIHAIEKLIISGADGFLPKTADQQSLYECLKAITNDESYLPGEVSHSVYNLIKRERKETGILTDREMDFLSLVNSSLTYEQIAQKLFLSPYSIGNLSKNIAHKTGCTSRHELCRLAMEMGL